MISGFVASGSVVSGVFPYAIGLWITAGVWGIIFGISRRQRVIIDILKIEIWDWGEGTQGYDKITIEGFISARHSDYLIEPRLCFLGEENYIPESPANRYQYSIDNSLTKTHWVYKVPHYVLEYGRRVNKRLGYNPIDIACICCVMHSGYYQSTSFRILPDITPKILRGGTMKKVKEIGISKKEYLSLLKKAAQPVEDKKRPPEKEKS